MRLKPTRSQYVKALRVGLAKGVMAFSTGGISIQVAQGMYPSVGDAVFGILLIGFIDGVLVMVLFSLIDIFRNRGTG